jgi:Trp operon repressor
MVDSRKGGVTADRIDHLTERVQVVEQREYTEFSHARLEAKMDVGFARIDRKLDQLIDAQRPRPKPKRRNE